MVLEAKIPDISIKAKRAPIRPPFNLSKFDLINSIDKNILIGHIRASCPNNKITNYYNTHPF